MPVWTTQAAERPERVDVAALERFAEASRVFLDDDVMTAAWRRLGCRQGSQV